MKRQHAWVRDSSFLAKPNRSGKFQVVGNLTDYIYKDDMDERKANDYADELNQNKLRHQTYPED